MLRRLLALLLILAVALPWATMDAAARQQAGGCECPQGSSDCGDSAKACGCALGCAVRLVAEPAMAVAVAPMMVGASADSVVGTRSALPAGAQPDTPFRPPRPTIPH
jgi:hypothetical protein